MSRPQRDRAGGQAARHGVGRRRAQAAVLGARGDRRAAERGCCALSPRAPAAGSAARPDPQLALLGLPQPGPAEPGQQHGGREQRAGGERDRPAAEPGRDGAGDPHLPRTYVDLRHATSPATVEIVGRPHPRPGARPAAPRGAGAPLPQPRRPLDRPAGSAPPRPAPLEPLPEIGAGQLAVTFGGHATVIARYPGLAIAFDPMLGRWIGGVRRAVEPGLAPGDLADVGLILISHRHADHLHVPTLRAAAAHRHRGRARPAPPPRCPAWASRAWSSCARRRPRAARRPGRGRGDRARRRRARARPVLRACAATARASYLCGDSGYFSGFADLGERFAPDIAVLPIGGFLPTSFRARHMSPLDALYAFEDLRARMLVPIHHGAFALSYERLDEPARWLVELAPPARPARSRAGDGGRRRPSGSSRRRPAGGDELASTRDTTRCPRPGPTARRLDRDPGLQRGRASCARR